MNRGNYDYIIIGSGFGGSVSALRLAEKGYRVLVIEKGKWYRSADFPRSNWAFSKWLWLPALRWFGIMKITFFRHVGIVSGTGVGGGSLVYANTLPVPKTAFFQSGSWKGLAAWEQELRPYYDTALRMLGGAPNPHLADGDLAMQTLAQKIDREEHFDATKVAVYFGTPGETVPDPYFGGRGPERSGCTFCGGCMTGCRHNAKNTLDKNYLHFAQQHGTEILAEHEVLDVRPAGAPDGADGYTVTFRSSTGLFRRKKTLHASGLVFAGGVLGTVRLLLKLRKRSLPRLSEKVGCDIRTNNESLLGITSLDKDRDLSTGIAIGSILHTDPDSHLEVCRYSKGSGAWRLSLLPFVEGPNLPVRFFRMLTTILKRPWRWLRYLFIRDWARSSVVLLFMQTLDSTLRLDRTRFGWMRTRLTSGNRPSAFIPQAEALARRYARLVNGEVTSFVLTPLAGIPGTAHILGGAVMGGTPETGVIDADNRVFGYMNMLVCDGSMISANPGVNPSLSITAIAERAMDKIPAKSVDSRTEAATYSAPSQR